MFKSIVLNIVLLSTSLACWSTPIPEPLADRIQGNWNIQNETLWSFLYQTAKKYQFSFSLEVNDEDQSNSFIYQKITLQKKQASLREVLDQIKTVIPNFCWQENQGVLNITQGPLGQNPAWRAGNQKIPRIHGKAHKETIRYLINETEIKDKFSPTEVIFDLKDLDKEWKHLRSPEIMVDGDNLTVRALLNRFVVDYAQAGMLTYWTIQSQKENSLFVLPIN